MKIIKNKKGFTLVEIIVVLVIVGILIAIAVPAVMGYIDEARNTKYMTVGRAVEQETLTYTQEYMIKNDDRDFKLVVKELKSKFSWGSGAAVTPPVSTKALDGEKIHSIDVSFDGKYDDSGWDYDATKTKHEVTKVSIWFATDDGKVTPSDARFVVIVLGEGTYYYEDYADAAPHIGKKEGPIIPR